MDENPMRQQFYAHLVKQISDDIENKQQSCLSDDQCESLEVAKQCLQTAFDLSDDSPMRFDHSLLNVYNAGLVKLGVKKEFPEPSAEDKEKAEKLKTQGNLCMSEKMFTEAIDCYSKAIDLVPNNAVFYCNRAAAFSRLENHDKAIQDCNTALDIDPNYTKAYGRMGSAYSSKGLHDKAADCYRKALELDPNNAAYQSSMSAAEKASKSSNSTPQAGFGRMAGQPTLGGLDFGALLNDPNTMNMVNQMLSNPQMQSMMNNIMSSMGGSGQAQANGASSATNNSAAPPADMGNLLRMGQQLAQQMQQANPDLVDSLRRQHQENNNDSTSNQNNEEPPPGSC